ncbi:2-phosphosulpholactate phosphatase [Paramicrobacterium humi]|uniref:Probable 2-phosphosulfolactate phosphatase n=1 Tax=Paramicrobacterium humi TaxID=640635 RepID=A0A1H4MVR8_9MICO|nr:2-phosphosulfolactate phosphatase [Microbacterium humi]SEB86917.1 2-phosphosulpholactate phosphatase [Microbacterium humi]
MIIVVDAFSSPEFDDHAQATVPVADAAGDAIATAARRYGVPVIAASLRNRTAAAQWVLAQQVSQGDRVRAAIVAAGSDAASPRFSVEDLLAAGAVIDALAELGIDYAAPEAAAACAAFTGLKRAVGHLLTASVAGKALAASGRREHVVAAGKLDSSTNVPVLGDEGYERA